MTPRGPAALAAALLLAGAWSAPAWAQVDLVSRETLSGVIDLRLSNGDDETGWRDGGFGKTRYGKGDAGVHVGDASLVWTPRLTWALSATVNLRYDPDDKEHPVDLVEGFVTFKPTPQGPLRYKARVGMFWPPISLEHDGVAWTLTDTITPSAINSWVGEELKVVGAEGTVSRTVADSELSATGAVFGYDDTSGTLLSFRGWALHDLKSTASGDFDLPPLSAFMRLRQAPETYSTLELDHRWGYYAAGQWRLPSRAVFDALYYDNNGDKTAVRAVQWSWDTRFWNLGMTVDVTGATRVLAQVMSGNTRMGFNTPNGIWVDVDFNAAYLLASQRFGRSTLTGRADWFETLDRSMQRIDNNDEHGWAATAAYRFALTPKADVRVEAVHVWSDRPSRAYGLLPATQRHTGLQAALRLTF